MSCAIGEYLASPRGWRNIQYLAWREAHRLRRPDLADDLVSLIAARLMRTAHRYDPARGSIANWVAIAVFWAGRDLLREVAFPRALCRRGTVVPLRQDVVDGKPGPDAGVDAADLLTNLARTLRHRERQVLLGRVAGLGPTVIARQMGVSESYVHLIWRAAKLKILQWFREHDISRCREEEET